MAMLGIIGGIGPESTVDYYQRIIARFRKRAPGRGYPALIVNSVDLDRLVQWFDKGRLGEVTDYLSAEIRRLEAAGATAGLLSANTPHLVFDALKARTALPLLSIVDAARDGATALGLKRLALLGTRFTMRANFYPASFRAAGLTLVVPTHEEQDRIHNAYMNELIPGVFRDETRAAIMGVVDRLAADEGADGVVLAGTELPLLLRNSARPGLPFLDTTALHVERAVDHLLTDAVVGDSTDTIEPDRRA